MITKNASDILHKAAAGVVGAAPVKPVIPAQQQLRVPRQNTQNTIIPPDKWPPKMPFEEIQTTRKGDTIWHIFKRHHLSLIHI